MNLISTSAMNVKRTQFSATPFGTSGLVLIVGGLDQNGNPLASAELFDPATGTFTLLAGSLNVARYNHAAIETYGGAIFIIGGQGAGAVYLASVEVFAAGSGRPEITSTFTMASNGLSAARGNLSAATLADGRIAVFGGADSGDAALNLAEIYAPGI